ncbi:MAG: helix-turn-helix transcriptional regulator [bacterium]|nr:helix-turn-helix transcriptional regulator [bacterium]
MVFQIHTPVYPLNLFIENFIYYRDFNPIHSLDRFLPDGNINIVFDLTDYPKYIYDNDTLKEIQACRNVWFSGIRNNYITIPSGKDSEMFIVNLKKGRAFPFVQMPLNELTDSVVDAELVLTNEILNLRENILAANDISQKFAIVEKHLMKLYKSKLDVIPVIDFAVNRILNSPDQKTIKNICDNIGYSQKHFIKIFKEKVGLTPKSFLKVIRFQKAVLEIESRKNINWQDIAFESGYYDQAHFIHDFKNFSGFTPNDYLLNKNDQLNYVPIG